MPITALCKLIKQLFQILVIFGRKAALFNHTDEQLLRALFADLFKQAAALRADALRLVRQRIIKFVAAPRFSEQELVKLPGKEQGLARLMRDALIAQEIFSMLAKRYEEARISEVMQPTDVQVVDVAVAPEDPIKPRKVLNILLAAVLGLFIGTALALGLEFLNRTVRTGDDVKHYLDLPVLGTIPDFANGRNLVKQDGVWRRLKVRFGNEQ